MGAGEIRAQPLAGLKLMRLDQGAAIASAPARQPSVSRTGCLTKPNFKYQAGRFARWRKKKGRI
jgi:hypothetical protein